MMRWSKSNIGMVKLQCLKSHNGTNPAGLTLCPADISGTRAAGVPIAAKHRQVWLPPGNPRQAILANLGRIVLESTLEIFNMNRVCAFWFYFYGFPQPLAEGLN